MDSSVNGKNQQQSDFADIKLDIEQQHEEKEREPQNPQQHQVLYSTAKKGGKNEEKEAFIVRPDKTDRASPLNGIRRSPHQQKSVSATVDDVSWLSFISFTWMFPWMWRAYRGRVSTSTDQAEAPGQWDCSIFDSANVNLKRLEHHWNLELQTAAHFGRPPSLFRTVLRFIRFRLALACFVFLFCIVFGFIGPTCLVRGLIAFTEKPYGPTGEEANGIDYSVGLQLAMAILFVEISRVLAYGATWAISYRTAIRTRGAVLAMLYKSLINSKSLRGKTPAEVVNMFANDGQRIFDAVTFAPLVLIGPLVLVGGLIYLLRVIGPVSLLAVSVFLIFDFIQAFLGISLVKCRNLAIAQTEKRMALIGEIIRCIKCIKLNCWEPLFYNKVCDVRNNEKRYLRIAGYTQSLMIAFGAVVPSVATIVMVLAIVLTGNDLKASDAFSAITVFFVMLFGVRMIPYGMRYLTEAVQSLTKIGSLLQYEKFDEEYDPPRASNLAIQMQNCTFTWDINEVDKSDSQDGGPAMAPKQNGTAVAAEKGGSKKRRKSKGVIGENASAAEEQTELNADEQKTNGEAKKAAEEFTLRDVNLSLEKGDLVGICGVIGSGKSALLNAITGHLNGHEGTISISGNIALCPQQPAILNSTIRDNILFGQPMNSQRYYKAISSAQLAKDLELFPENERSKISGCKLSGGQRSRISVARALYSNRDIYLFDDIFSSIDKPVAEKIFAQGIREMLASKTRLVVTCDPDFLAQCSKVIFMDRGHILAMETHNYLLQHFEPYRIFFASTKMPTGNEPNLADVQKHQNEKAKKNSSEENKLQHSASKSTVNTSADKDEEREEDLGLKPVGKEIYMEYIRAGGGKFICFIVLLAFCLNVSSNIFSTVWLSKWMRDVHGDERHIKMAMPNGNDTTAATSIGHSLGDPDTGLSFYASIYIFNMVFLFVTGLFKAMMFVRLTLTASTQLHNRMLKSVLYAVASFFHQTPSGRILNRFSKDMDEIDVKLPFSAEALLQGMITCIGFLLVIIWVFPMFLVPIIPLFMLFLLFFVCFRAGIRSLKRVENVTRSPLYEHLASSLDALPTIHAFGQTPKFVEQLKGRLDENSGALFLYHSAMRWQAVWLDLLVVCVTFVVALFIVLLTGRISPSEAGMAIAFALQMSGIFQFAVRSQTELEAKLTAVERVSHYYKTIEVEQTDNEDAADLPKDWPSTGQLQFDNVVLRYSPNATTALDHVSFSVGDAEKMGIVGRTGSGKTSICNALCRLYPLESGKIQLDHRDISTLNLHRLRHSMAIISQEATLFAGTLRFNIDPEGSCGGDDKIWECLDRICLGESVNMFTDKLDFVVEQGGKNLSAGQRQLVCLVRALLRDTKIVILDEATANIDVQTDILLQRAVQEFFAGRTILLITHRLANVVGVNRIMEMEDGKVKSIEPIAPTTNVASSTATGEEAMTSMTTTMAEDDVEGQEPPEKATSEIGQENGPIEEGKQEEGIGKSREGSPPPAENDVED